MQDRAATRRDGVDQHHRRLHAHARDFRLEGALVFAVIMRDIGGGAAHVEADHLAEPGGSSRLGETDHAAGGAGEYGILALKQIGGGEPAR